MLIAILIFVCLPLVMALLSKVAYNLFFPLTKINKKAESYDNEHVNIPYNADTIGKLREYEKIGDKIVFTHNLTPQVNEFRRIVQRTFLKTLFMEFVLLVVLSMGAAQKDNNADLFPNILLVIKEYKVYYYIPLGMIALCFEFVFYYSFLNEQITKYKLN